MSKAKRLRRARQRRKRKWLKRARKIQRRYDRELQHSELLTQFQAYIDEEFHRGEITLYRWAHNPYTSDDFKPQIFQSFSTRDISDVFVPSPTGSRQRIKKYVEYFTLSHFISEEQAVSRYMEVISGLADSGHPERAEGFKENKGTYVQRCVYGEDDIVYGTPDEKGHIDALLCKGFDPERVIDTTYTPVKIV